MFFYSLFYCAARFCGTFCLLFTHSFSRQIFRQNFLKKVKVSSKVSSKKLAPAEDFFGVTAKEISHFLFVTILLKNLTNCVKCDTISSRQTLGRSKICEQCTKIPVYGNKEGFLYCFYFCAPREEKEKRI